MLAEETRDPRAAPRLAHHLAGAVLGEAIDHHPVIAEQRLDQPRHPLEQQFDAVDLPNAGNPEPRDLEGAGAVILVRRLELHDAVALAGMNGDVEHAPALPTASWKTVPGLAGPAERPSALRKACATCPPSRSVSGMPLRLPAGRPSSPAAFAEWRSTPRILASSASRQPCGWILPGIWTGSRSQLARSTLADPVMAPRHRKPGAPEEMHRARIRSPGPCSGPLRHRGSPGNHAMH